MANLGGGPVPVQGPFRISGSEGDGTNGPIRARSRVACQSCNHRKVRCDVTRTGIPCSNCLHERGHCEVLPRKKHRPRRTRAALQSLRPTTQYDPTKDGMEEGGNTSCSTSQGNGIPIHNNHGSHAEKRTSNPHRLSSASQPEASSVGQSSPYLESGSTSHGHARSKDSSHPLDSEDALPDDSSLSYIGDRRGPRFFVYDLTRSAGSPQDAMPYLNPRKSDISWKPHEVEYLRQQGAFATFSDDVCDDLVRCYFNHVHFFLPVVDATSFLTEYNNGRQNISLLLFWSMLLAAANFVETDVLEKAGFTSRKAMKTAIYARAKCLYDLDRGTEKLVLIQSVILMGFWYTDPQDHTGAWYWIGIAISLSQTLGLHRQLSNRSQQLPESQQPLIRRIWWSCLVRDRWISLAKGRPMRIHHEDCDVPMPTAEDIIKDLDSIPVQTRNKFVPSESEMLSKMWINIVEISSTLGRILRTHYRVNGPKAMAEDIHDSAEDIRYCKPRGLHVSNRSEILRLHAFHVELFYEATVAVLYRPYVLSGPSAQPFEVQPSVQTLALDQARAAAFNTNSVLERIIELNLVHFLKPMMITTIIPAMQIFLFDCKSTEPLRRGLGTNKLNLCMLVLSQLRNTYWSASVTYRLFSRAQALLDKSKSSAFATAEKPTPSPQRITSQSSNQDLQTEQLQHDQDQQHSQLPQQQAHPLQQEYANMRLMPDANILANEPTIPSWMNDPQYFSNVDQLLSPGFTIPENTFNSFFAGYDNSMGVYDQNVPISGEVPMHMLYQS